MNIVVTATGHEIDVEHGLGTITIEAIAHSLSQINRFNGHAMRPYSVAEHSLLVVEIIEHECAPLQVSAHALLAALMHDAHEAISSDLHSPGKAVIGAAWAHWEDRFESMVRSQFALHTASTTYRDLIHKADLVALATERRDLLPSKPEASAWPVLHGVEPVTWVDLRSLSRRTTRWESWRERFLDRFHQLDLARCDGLLRNRVGNDAPSTTKEKSQ